MSFVRCILGDVEAGRLGVCYAHEHVIIDQCFVSTREPEFLLDSVEKAVAELRQFRSDGGRAMIDAMPGGCGRNAEKLAEVSRASGVHIVCPTGVHLRKHYPPDQWPGLLEEEELVERFIDEIERGIDDGAGRREYRAGIIKVAGGRDRLSSHERTVFRAAAAASAATGCPIITHAEEGTAALEQVEILASAGADLRHVTLSHLDRNQNIDYHRSVLKTGARLEYDSAFRWAYGNPTLEMLVALAPEFPTQIMLGMDAARNKYWRSYGGEPGLSFLLMQFIPSLRAAGLEQELIDRLFVKNPAEAYSFAAAAGNRRAQEAHHGQKMENRGN